MPDEVRAILYTDGASKGNPGPAGAGFVLTDAQGGVLVERSVPLGRLTVGVAEYKALISGLSEALSRRVTRIQVRSDSEFMCKQLQGKYKVRTPAIRPLYEWAVKLRARFSSFEIRHIPREQNAHADKLASAAAQREANGERS